MNGGLIARGSSLFRLQFRRSWPSGNIFTHRNMCWVGWGLSMRMAQMRSGLMVRRIGPRLLRKDCGALALPAVAGELAGNSMSWWLRAIGSAALWAVLGSCATSAATSSRMDILPDDTAGSPAESVDVGAVRPIARPVQPASKPVPRGNPLWSVPLSALTATQERPIFSASRRPPPRAVAASPVDEVRSPPPPKPVEAPPPLLLVGAVVGEGDAIAILVNRIDQKVVRLRQGESLGGWSLTDVQPREVTLKQGNRSEVLALQRPSDPAPAPAGPPADGGGRLTMPGTTDTPFAPFQPRSTPKNGESDGL
jgi:general secretion pathway protein N